MQFWKAPVHRTIQRPLSLLWYLVSMQYRRNALSEKKRLLWQRFIKQHVFEGKAC